MPDAANLSLLVGLYEYRDIKRCTVTRAIDQIADEVSIELADTWAETGALAVPFVGGDEFELRVDDELWVTGFLTAIPMEYGGQSHSISVSGLSKAGQLTTSCHKGPPRTWKDVTIDQIFRDVCGPYGIGVNVYTENLGKPFTKFAATIGEQAFDVLRRALAKRGLWSVSEENGDIAIIETGQDRFSTPLIGQRVPGQPTNVLSGSRNETFTDTYSEVIVVGQGSGSANWTGEQQSNGYAIATNPAVKTHRPLVVHDSGESGHEKLQRRADWEMRTRVGKAYQLSYTLQGYRAEREVPRPLPWLPNHRVDVIDGWLDIEEEMLIERVTTNFDPSSGTTTTLDLVAPQTYEVLAPPPKNKTRPRGRKGQFTSWG